MNEKILIVEDEPQMLRLLGLTLEKEGVRIAAAQLPRPPGRRSRPPSPI